MSADDWEHGDVYEFADQDGDEYEWGVGNTLEEDGSDFDPTHDFPDIDDLIDLFDQVPDEDIVIDVEIDEDSP